MGKSTHEKTAVQAVQEKYYNQLVTEGFAIEGKVSGLESNLTIFEEGASVSDVRKTVQVLFNDQPWTLFMSPDIWNRYVSDIRETRTRTRKY